MGIKLSIILYLTIGYHRANRKEEIMKKHPKKLNREKDDQKEAIQVCYQILKGINLDNCEGLIEFGKRTKINKMVLIGMKNRIDKCSKEVEIYRIKYKLKKVLLQKLSRSKKKICKYLRKKN